MIISATVIAILMIGVTLGYLASMKMESMYD